MHSLSRQVAHNDCSHPFSSLTQVVVGSSHSLDADAVLLCSICHHGHDAWCGAVALKMSSQTSVPVQSCFAEYDTTAWSCAVVLSMSSQTLVLGAVLLC